MNKMNTQKCPKCGSKPSYLAWDLIYLKCESQLDAPNGIPSGKLVFQSELCKERCKVIKLKNRIEDLEDENAGLKASISLLEHIKCINNISKVQLGMPCKLQVIRSPDLVHPSLTSTIEPTDGVK